MQPLPYLILRSLWRFLITGRSLRGTPTDNATFMHAATRDDRGKPVEKLSGPIWHRLAWRWAVLGAPLLFIAASGVARLVQAVTDAEPLWTRYDWFALALRWWIIGTVTGLCYGVYRIVRHIQTREATREFKEPAWQAACDAMGHRFKAADARVMVDLPDDFEPPDIPPAPPGRFERWLERRRGEPEPEPVEDEDTSEPSGELVPIGDAELDTYRPPPWQRLIPRRPVNEDVREEPVRITLPPGKCATKGEQDRFKQKVGPVLGMPDTQADWILRGRSPYVELRPNHPPPLAVGWGDVRKHFEAADLDHPLGGIAAGGKAVSLDYLNDSPHVLISGGSGTGKSTLVRAIECQRMHWGAATVWIDLKRISHRWAHNLPGSLYAWRLEDAHNVLVRAGLELERRIETVLPEGEDIEAELTKFRTVDLILEEINATSRRLQTFWQETRESGDPVQSPAVSAIKLIVDQGREYCMHVVTAGQRVSSSVFGANGGDTRESFAERWVSKWTKKTWFMLADGTPWQRFPGGGRGVWARITDDTAEIVRVPLLTDQQAREWAVSGVVCPGTPLGGDLTLTADLAPMIPAPAEPRELVPLRAAFDMLPGPPMTWDAFRKASQRRGFPDRVGWEGVAGTYRLVELREWKESRDNNGRRPLTLVGTRPGVVYQIDTLNPATGAVEIGYIGQTRQKLSKREDQHRGDKPWADLIVGSPVAIWERDACTNDELDDAERDAIHRLRPRYNYEHQEGAEHAVPLWEQKEDRQLRNRARGLPPWVPEDRYGMSQLSHAGMS